MAHSEQGVGVLHGTTDCREGSEVGARSRRAPHALRKIGVI